MLLGLTYQLMRFITDLVLVRTRSDAQLRAEVLALRHQLRLLERKVGKPAWQPADRILLAGLSRLLPKSGLPVPLERRDKTGMEKGMKEPYIEGVGAAPRAAVPAGASPVGVDCPVSAVVIPDAHRR